MSEEPQNSAEPEGIGESEANVPRSTRFRFKSKEQDDRRGDDRDRDARSHKRRRDHDSSHRRRTRHKSSKHSEDEHHNRHSSTSTSHLPPDDAFRESLFDALGDDEGASFWEGVYGQPIHNFPNTYQDEETGELERMTDDEYAQFVRRKMWEKSWEGIEAAREEKRQAREREKQRIREEEASRRSRGGSAHAEVHDHDYDYVFDTQIEASLRRGERRKDRKRWRGLWEDYLRRWDELQTLAQTRAQRRDEPEGKEDGSEQLFLRNKIAWPVETGKRKDVTKEEIERFVRKGTDGIDTPATESAGGGSRSSADAFANAVKMERVRWHPDKIQQRYGFMEIDETTLKGVTAVFQVFDALWNDIREQAV